MTYRIIVDVAGAPRVFGNRKQLCPMTVDGPIEELHAFAKRLGLQRRSFQPTRARGWSADRYNLTPAHRALAIQLGAVEMSGQEQAKMHRAARHDGLTCVELGCVVPRGHASRHRSAYGATWPKVDRG